MTFDVSGTQTIPTTVVGLQGRRVAATMPQVGQALVWTGTEWAPGTVSGGGGGGGTPPSTGGGVVEGPGGGVVEGGGGGTVTGPGGGGGTTPTHGGVVAGPGAGAVSGAGGGVVEGPGGTTAAMASLREQISALEARLALLERSADE